MVAIAHNKGVVMRKTYTKMDGPFFASFVEDHLNLCFANAGPKVDGKRIFVMDNCPCQNSKVAKVALEGIECSVHRIPARSPDLNPIENVFHIVKQRLDIEALDLHIERESFEQFQQRVFRCMDNLDVSIVDKTIESMPKRIDSIIKSKGMRLKY